MEGRALADVALDPDPPPVCLREATGDGEPEARSLARTLARLPERIEEMRQLRLGDAGTGVRDREPHLPLRRLGPNGDRAPGRRELEGVADQVGEDLEDPVPVDLDRRQRARDLRPELNPFVGCERAMELDGLAKERRRFLAALLDRQLAGLHPG